MMASINLFGSNKRRAAGMTLLLFCCGLTIGTGAAAEKGVKTGRYFYCSSSEKTGNDVLYTNSPIAEDYDLFFEYRMRFEKWAKAAGVYSEERDWESNHDIDCDYFATEAEAIADRRPNGHSVSNGYGGTTTWKDGSLPKDWNLPKSGLDDLVSPPEKPTPDLGLIVSGSTPTPYVPRLEPAPLLPPRASTPFPRSAPVIPRREPSCSTATGGCRTRPI